MYIGTSIFLIALGAILAFAVNATVAGFEIQTAGVILMVVGVIGLVISFALMTVWSDRRRRADLVERDRVVERDRPVQP
jgi:membrane protein implicated in regulation of membrane protease activity